ncbi:MAG TPA: hypothetical protein VGR76_21795 [Candidatus Angelobacter sp.]|jgi:hypothetical protein|nr:hypothetical protein [Candidatus Angelobacter sp.]
MIRNAATLILFVLLAVATVFAQNPAGTSNSPGSTPQSQNPAVPNTNNGAASPADVPQGTTGQASAPAQNPPGPSTAVIDEVGAGTEIHAALDTPLSSKTSKPGDRFTATVSDPVRAANGAIVIPAGARVEGEVSESEDEKTLTALKDKPKLSLRLRDVVLPTGQTLPLTATLVSVHQAGGKNPQKVITDRQIESGRNGIGADTPTSRSFGGPIKGLAIGALSGGGYVVTTNGKDVHLPAQAGMLIRVDQPLSWNGTSAPTQR